MQQCVWFIHGDSLDWQGDIDEAVAWETISRPGKAPSFTLSIPRLSPSLLIPIEKGKGRLGKQEWMRRRRGVTEQAKGSTDIHGNLQIHSVVIISINAERQWRGEGRGHGAVGEFWGWGWVGWRGRGVV